MKVHLDNWHHTTPALPLSRDTANKPSDLKWNKKSGPSVAYHSANDISITTTICIMPLLI